MIDQGSYTLALSYVLVSTVAGLVVICAVRPLLDRVLPERPELSTVGALAQLGMSSQLLAFGICIVAGAPAAAGIRTASHRSSAYRSRFTCSTSLLSELSRCFASLPTIAMPMNACCG